MYKTLSITLLSHRIRNHDFSNCCDAGCLRQQTVPSNLKANYRVERTEFTVSATTVTPAKCQPLPRLSSDRMTSLTSSSTVADHLILPPTDKYVVVDQQPFYYNLPQPSAAYAEPRQMPHDNELLILSTNTEERQISCINSL